jgi:hypothetical protein
VANARRERVVDCRVAERALNAHRLHWSARGRGVAALEEGRHAHDRVEPEQRNGRSGVVQVDGAVLDPVHDGSRQGVHVDLQTELQGGRRAHAVTEATVGRADDRLVQLDRIAPEHLVAEGVETKRLASLGNERRFRREGRRRRRAHLRRARIFEAPLRLRVGRGHRSAIVRAVAAAANPEPPEFPDAL